MQSLQGASAAAVGARVLSEIEETSLEEVSSALGIAHFRNPICFSLSNLSVCRVPRLNRVEEAGLPLALRESRVFGRACQIGWTLIKSPISIFPDPRLAPHELRDSNFGQHHQR
jgi:hypothetical protein